MVASRMNKQEILVHKLIVILRKELNSVFLFLWGMYKFVYSAATQVNYRSSSRLHASLLNIAYSSTGIGPDYGPLSVSI